MPGIYVMAIVAAIAALTVLGGIILAIAPRRTWPALGTALLLALPMSAAAFLLVRRPLDEGVKALGLDPGVYGFVASWYAPLTEEPAKLLPLLLPLLFRRVDRETAVPMGLALGLGFGLGEVGFLAWLLGQNPQVAALPWHLFTGFLAERIPVCFLHGAFTAIVIALWVRGRRWGILAAMLLHYLLNFVIYFASVNSFGLGRAAWIQISLAWTVLMTIAMALTVAWLHRGRRGVQAIVGRDHACPGCGETYRAPLLGLNLVLRRWERCPHCRRWHFV